MNNTVTLPPGCAGFTSADGTKDPAKPGTKVQLSDEHFARLAKSQHITAGVITLNPGMQIGTKAGRRCPSCRFLGQAWATECRRCGGATVPE